MASIDSNVRIIHDKTKINNVWRRIKLNKFGVNKSMKSFSNIASINVNGMQFTALIDCRYRLPSTQISFE